MKLLAAILVLSSFAAEGETNTAASASYEHVLAAYRRCTNHGDTLLIPPGTNTWGSVIEVTNAISIIGAGTNDAGQTRITGSAFLLTPRTNLSVRVTGIHFYQADWATEYIVTLIGDCRQFRVDHCYFTRGKRALSWGGDGGGRRGATGPAYGVVDHNTFWQVNISCYVQDEENGENGTTGYGANAWTRGLAGAYAPGTTNSVVLEDNVFYHGDEITLLAENGNQHLYGWVGARATFRNNFVLSTSEPNASSWIDGHGQYPVGEDIMRSTMLFEIYSNVFHGVSVAQPCGQRGGAWIMHNNAITNGTQNYVELVNEHGTGDSTSDAITNSFFWNNTFNGGAFASPLPVPEQYPFTGSVNTHYWMHEPASTNNFYPYSPLVYPHPLVTAQDGKPPAAVSGSATAARVNVGRLIRR